jgi:hypothetical protein
MLLTELLIVYASYIASYSMWYFVGIWQVLYNGSMVEDLFTGAYNVYTPATRPGLYTIGISVSEV